MNVLTSLVLFTTAWLLVAGTDPSSWLIGVPAVLLATRARVVLSRGGGVRLSPMGFLRFFPYFVWESVRGGADVARRVLRPGVPVSPGFVRYTLSTDLPAARVLFVDAISLLPGTLSADLRGQEVVVHALDTKADIQRELERLEWRVAQLFREPQARPERPPALPIDPLTVAGRLLLFGFFWMLVAGVDSDSWTVGLPVVIAATWISVRLAPEPVGRISPLGLARFVLFYLEYSLRGGIDVASRVLRPRVSVAPGFSRYRPQLTDPGALVVFMNSISLLPGTLSADWKDKTIIVHSLDGDADLAAELERLESRVAQIFGESIGNPAYD